MGLKKTYNSLQYLRGIACWLVIFYHLAKIYNQLNFNGWGQYFFYGGEFGVDIFFVLSGFVMTLSLEKSNGINSLKELITFLKTRWFRIAPAYFFWMAFFIILFQQGACHLNIPSKNIIYATLFLPGSWPYPPLPIGWTLNFEMYFYVVLAVFYYFRQHRTLLLFLAVCPILGKILPTDITYLSKIVFSKYVWEFLFGILLFKYQHYIQLNKSKTLLLCVITGIIFGYFYTINFPQGINIRVIVAALLVLSFIKLEEHYTFNNKYLLFLGDTSYSTYLCHLPILSYFSYLIKEIVSETLSESVILFSLLPVIVFISYLSYQYLEKPFIQLGKKINF
jgi:peptidoglycan/LPS O-acetylase OafA/YrhL